VGARSQRRRGRSGRRVIRREARRRWKRRRRRHMRAQTWRMTWRKRGMCQQHLLPHPLHHQHRQAPLLAGYLPIL
jgi:hypothetical protein